MAFNTGCVVRLCCETVLVAERSTCRNSLFGAKPATGSIFGTQSTAPKPQTNLFGNSVPNISTFGTQNQAQPAQGTSLFGGQPQQQGAQAPQPIQPPSLFNQPAQTTQQPASLFGNTQQPQQNTAPGLFSQQGAQAQMTTAQPGKLIMASKALSVPSADPRRKASAQPRPQAILYSEVPQRLRLCLATLWEAQQMQPILCLVVHPPRRTKRLVASLLVATHYLGTAKIHNRREYPIIWTSVLVFTPCSVRCEQMRSLSS